jgi:putative cell wall-binding protein
LLAVDAATPAQPVAATTETTSGVPTIVRGSDRYDTAAAVAAYEWPQGAATAYVVTGEEWADGLAAIPAASADGAPVLLTRRASLPDETATALRSLHPGRVVIVGGAAAVSDAVAAGIASVTSAAVQRIAGADRYATAAAVAGRWTTAPAVWLASGENYPDALAAGAAAAKGTSPVLLVRATSVPHETATTIERLAPERIWVAGGEPHPVADTLRRDTGRFVGVVSGADRIETAVGTSAVTFDTAHRPVFAYGDAWPDAIVGGAAAAHSASPLLLRSAGCESHVVDL